MTEQSSENNRPAASYDFKVCKLCRARAGRPVYRLRGPWLYICSECGGHYIDYLDPPHPAGEAPPHVVTAEDRKYFEKTQHHNRRRLASQVALVQSYRDLEGLRVLDIGSGGGVFLGTIRDGGAVVCGVELGRPAVAYSQETYGFEVYSKPVEDRFWREEYRESFDVVTMWDVIEHVNFPRETIEAAAGLLKPGGLFMISTPCRDTFYHRTGKLTAKLTFGKFPTFLNIMYANLPFAHKQILSVGDLERLFGHSGMRVIHSAVIMELALPYRHYMRKLLRSDALAAVTAPIARAAIALSRIRNKMIVVAEKPS